MHTHMLFVDAIIDGDWSAVWDIFKHLILPATTLGLVFGGVFIRLVRVNVIRTLKDDYIEAARARGIRERSVVYRHAFRNALVPVITVVGLQIALLLGGAVLTETTFNWPGIGHALLIYLQNRDYAAVQGIIVVFALVVVVASLVDRLRERLHRPEDAVLMAVADRAPPRTAALKPGLRAAPAGRSREARGFARAMLWAAPAITVFFVVLAIFAPLISPYGFDQYPSGGDRLPAAAAPSAATCSARPCSRPTCSRG